MGLRNMKDKFGESMFVKCDCCCNLLEINFDFELKHFSIAMWTSGDGIRPLPKSERIRWCEHIMKTGNPWADHTIVSQQDARRIAKFVTKQLAQHGK